MIDQKCEWRNAHGISGCLYLCVCKESFVVVEHYILILCNSPLEFPTLPRGVFIWFALDGAFDV